MVLLHYRTQAIPILPYDCYKQVTRFRVYSQFITKEYEANTQHLGRLYMIWQPSTLITTSLSQRKDLLILANQVIKKDCFSTKKHKSASSKYNDLAISNKGKQHRQCTGGCAFLKKFAPLLLTSLVGR